MQKPRSRAAAKKSPLVETADDKRKSLDLSALQQTPGFMIRILQLLNFEAFFRHFQALEVSPVEYSILMTVRDNEAVTQSELAAVLKMQLPNLVKILSAMEEAGIVRRKRSSRDKRAVELSLSAAGQRRADEASRAGETFNEHTLAPLSKPERAAFLQMLTRLVDAYRHELSRSNAS
ncbi:MULTISPECIES: MarR family winged helix-turn-helix transcriptional regulator [unclassified Bradyrhizobium]|uniref:MarR family winged helix-turn-helix transcriptional regulator n=1 Tax=unclassified Bradyrhizobium TaxID=2631580 RepID=UPI001BA70A59|nr:MULTISPECIES: MarR family winged helix-turn-helix transcriptional regulator [unclassified Bradyrhizobium]MBR1228064.1 winged helix-turn-helix transcriptional regulator [Bradyrhizobium sp. AUGA SZCCT0176]MBR1230824.1 winged helix-turn-helix transcriptional regulator [Bradyrhizobium sp. AUGA SZCCT0182]MBR1300892.1 winged helix-turn-helix transcriptional regulator [Bradyrhizobium sp. AUGA SZCCT0042]